MSLTKVDNNNEITINSGKFQNVIKIEGYTGEKDVAYKVRGTAKIDIDTSKINDTMYIETRVFSVISDYNNRTPIVLKKDSNIVEIEHSNVFLGLFDKEDADIEFWVYNNTNVPIKLTDIELILEKLD